MEEMDEMGVMDGNVPLPDGFVILSPHTGSICYYFEPITYSEYTFSLTGEIGTLFFHRCNKEATEKENQVAVFPRGVTIRVDLDKLPEHILAHPAVGERGKEILRLSYQNPRSGAWEPFQSQVVQNDVLEVNFHFWYKDPGLGWVVS
ncbi:MAG: hypothetical protein P8Y68_19260 [Anaerolineales bacterium]|jgi:hypothetical protein